MTGKSRINVVERDRKGKHFVSIKFSVNSKALKITGQDEMKGRKNVLPC